jgi:hypothetical protein
VKRALTWPALYLICACGVSACASSSSAQKKDAELTREERCVLLLRELRLYCKDGLRDERASAGLECLSRRLELRKLCE